MNRINCPLSISLYSFPSHVFLGDFRTAARGTQADLIDGVKGVKLLWADIKARATFWLQLEG